MIEMELKEKLKLLPKQPGCYLMEDSKGEVIYVGKAKNLSNRVRSYFTGAHNEKTTMMISEIADFSYVITNSEQESLLLEINLIKRYLPKYNIRLVDDKTYPFILITNEPHPRLLVIRSKNMTEKAFGPFPNAYSARETVDILNKLYPFRKCKNIPKEACLYYHIGQCLAPCINEVPLDSYDDMIKEVTRFLKGDTKEVLDKLKSLMKKASDNLEYEKANEYKEMIMHIEKTTEKQIISLNDLKDRDFISYAYNEDEIAIQILMMRSGQISDTHQVVFSYVGSADEVALNYIDQIYGSNLYIDEILFDEMFDIDELRLRFKNKAIIPKIGDKKKIIKLAHKNAKEILENQNLIYKHQQDINLENDKKLKEIFKRDIKRIEVFDNSGLFGTNLVSAMIVYDNHQFLKHEYRKYNLRVVKHQDDYGALKEVIYRRYYRVLMEDLPIPDLILVDGGKGQVNVTLEVINSLRIDTLVAGLKKDDKHKLYSIIFNDREYVLKKNSNLYKMLGKISDEIHRYAVSFHKQSRLKTNFKSPLDSIPGIGKKRKEILLKNFDTIENIKNASIEEFKKIGIGEKLAKRIKEELK